MTTTSTKTKTITPAVSPDEHLYQRLVNAIVEKSLRPGEHVNELQLAEAYAIPRIRVRRVLERLALEGVIEFKPNRGAFILRPSVKEATDVFEARIHLEPIIFRLACERATDSDLHRLRLHLDKERKAFERRQRDFNRIAGDFHIEVAKIADNHVLLNTVKLLIHRTCLIQPLYEATTAILCFVDDHQHLVDLLTARAVDRIAQASADHCRHIMESLDLSDTRRLTTNIYDAGYPATSAG